MNADAAQFEIYWPGLTGHCYRMLGSIFDADDAVQETMIRAWKAFDLFDGRASLRSWLYRIATNLCLDELKNRGRRARPMEEGSPGSGAPPVEALTQQSDAYWIEPILDRDICGVDASPEEKALLRRLSCGRGCGDAGHVRGVGQQRAAAGFLHVERLFPRFGFPLQLSRK